MRTLPIGPRLIGEGQLTFIIAEIGINHNGDLDTAKKMIDAAKACGVDAVKFQTFNTEEFISDRTQTYTYYSEGKKVTESMFEMFKRYEFTENQWVEVLDYCKKKKIIFFSSPQNPSDLDFLLSIADLPAIKVGSDDLVNLPLLKYYASKQLPMIISAGMASLAEVESAVDCIRNTGNRDLTVLHCVSSYPTEAQDVNLRKMKTIEQAFQVVVGFSDHTIGTTAAIAAVALGAKAIEKHFTLDKNLPGPDHWFSIDTKELKDLVNNIRYTEAALGSPIVTPTKKENEMRKIARRSIVAKRKIRKGKVITEDMINFKRPGFGLAPMFVKYIVGKKAINDIAENERITFDNVRP